MRTLHVQTTNRRAARQCATRHEDGLARDETGPQTMPHATDATAMRQQYLFIPARRRARAASSSCTPWRMSVQRLLRRLPRTDNARKRVTEADAKRTGMGTKEKRAKGEGGGKTWRGIKRWKSRPTFLYPAAIPAYVAYVRRRDGRRAERGNEVNDRGYYDSCNPHCRYCTRFPTAIPTLAHRPPAPSDTNKAWNTLVSRHGSIAEAEVNAQREQRQSKVRPVRAVVRDRRVHVSVERSGLRVGGVG